MGNAANAELAGGGGVDSAIHQAGGPEIMKACRAIGSCAIGSAVLTSAGQLPAKFVAHAVGPVWKDGQQGEESLLCSAYTKCLDLLQESGLRHISLPAISAGVYGYPKEEAARVSWEAVKGWIDSQTESRLRITFVLYDSETHDIYTNQLLKTF